MATPRAPAGPSGPVLRGEVCDRRFVEDEADHIAASRSVARGETSNAGGTEHAVGEATDHRLGRSGDDAATNHSGGLAEVGTEPSVTGRDATLAAFTATRYVTTDAMSGKQ